MAMNAVPCDDKAFLSGNVHAAITLLHDALQSFVAEKVQMFSHEPESTANCDFSQLLYYVKNNWSEQFSHCCPADLKTVATTVIEIRNQISHQDFALNCYESYMKELAKLADLINQPAIEKKILTLHKMGVVKADIYSGQEEKQWWKLKDEGNAFFAGERWTDAKNCYTKAIQVTSTQAVLFSNRALCELHLQQYELAREDAEKSISLDSSKIKYYRILSDALEKLNLYEESLDVCRKGLKVDPRDHTLLIRIKDMIFVSKSETGFNNPTFWLKEGATYENVKQDILNQKIKLFTDCMKLNPKPEDVEYLSASAMSKRNKLGLEYDNATRYLIDYKNDIKNQQKAFEIYETVANENCAEGLYNTALYYFFGKGYIIRDAAKGKELLLKAASQKPFLKSVDLLWRNIGVAEAENALGCMFRDGNSEDKNDNKAFQWFIKSAEHDCPEGQNNLGHVLRHGIGCKQDLASARGWFESAAEKHVPEAQNNLAELLGSGEGGNKNIRRAYDLYKAAANQGLFVALIRLQELAQSFALGPSIKIDACNLLQDLTNKKDSNACLLLGLNYFKGEGDFAEDFEQAEKYLRMAVNFGNNNALLPLSNVLYEVKKNEDGYDCLDKACRIGISEAYLILGKYCAYGHGCDRNETEARKWLMRANNAIKHNEVGEVNVESILASGKDIVEWEIISNNSANGFSFTERVNRHFTATVIQTFDTHDQELFSNLSLLSETNKSLLSPKYVYKQNIEEWRKQMHQCTLSGSLSAQNFFSAMKKVEDAELLISNGFLIEGFQTIRLARRSWGLLLCNESFCDAAHKALLENPNNSEALFYIANQHNGQTLKENIPLLQRCVEIEPSVADYHYLLGCQYVNAGHYKLALRELDRALELYFCPLWLYDRAMALYFSAKFDSGLFSRNRVGLMKAIAAFEVFLQNNPPDSRKVPEVYFIIGLIYTLLNDLEHAEIHWKKGVAAETLRLPCFEQIDENFVPRQSLQLFVATLKQQNQRKVQNEHVKKCIYCESDFAAYKCSTCKIVRYCSKDCQTNHWKSHKLTCNKI